MVLWVIGSISHGGPFELLFLPVLHSGCNKHRGICYTVCGMMHVKDPLLLIEKSCPYSGGSRFPLTI